MLSDAIILSMSIATLICDRDTLAETFNQIFYLLSLCHSPVVTAFALHLIGVSCSKIMSMQVSFSG